MKLLRGLLITVIFLALIVEGGLRLLGRTPLVTINRFDDNYGWTKTPSTSTTKSTSEFDITYTINSRGLRDDEDVTYEKPEGEYRILVVGDSFPLGYTVDRDALFVDLLERSLRDDGHKVQVINGGTEGYSTDQYATWLRHEGLKYDPDAVVVTSYLNDIHWNAQESYVGKGKPRFELGSRGERVTNDPYPLPETEEVGWLTRNTATAGLFYAISTGLKHGASLVYKLPSGQQIPREEGVLLTTEPSYVAEDWKYTQTALEALHDIAAKKNIPLMLAIIPIREQVHPSFADAYLEKYDLPASQVDFAKPNRRMAQVAGEAGLDVLDPVPTFKAKAKESPDKLLYFTEDWHFNEDGNRLFADALLEAIRSRGWLPPPKKND